VTGTALCPDELSGWLFSVEIAFGADLTADSTTWTWTDVTSDVLQESGVNISPLGGQDENPQTPAAGCTFTLDNRQNLYSKNNPLCSNYPNVRNNTPVRVRISTDNGSTWYLMFHGEATVWQPDSDPTGTYIVTRVTAKGRSQRSTQHTSPLRSAMYRTISGTTFLAYWPLEDGTSAVYAASASSSILPMYTNGTLPAFASVTGPDGSDSVADFSGGGSLTGSIPVGVYTSYRLEASVKMPAIASGDFATVINWRSQGDVSEWELTHDDDAGGGLFAQYIASDGAVASQFPGTPVYVDDGKWHHLRIDISKNVASTVFKLTVDNVLVLTWNIALAYGVITSVRLNPNGDTTVGTPAIGHVAVWGPWSGSADTYDAFRGHAGESPNARFARLAGEEGIETITVGTDDTPVAMGPQSVDSYINLVQEAATTADAFLYDGQGAGQQWQTLSDRYNRDAAVTLDITASEVMPLVVPLDDDLRLVNQATVDRRNGTTEVAELTTGPLGTGSDGVGVIGAQVSVNQYDDHLVDDRAWWEVWKGAGSGGGFRYPMLTVNLRSRPALAARWFARGDGVSGPVMPGCRIDLEHLSDYVAAYPPGTVRLILLGIAYRISTFVFESDILMAPYRQYDVQEVGNRTTGRLNSSGSTLSGDVSLGATSLSIATTSSASQPWTTMATYPSDFPLHVEIEGIDVTVHSIGAALNSNIDFESGISGWSGQNGWTIAADTTYPFEGTGAMKLTPPGGTASGGAVATGVAVTPGTSYYLGGWWYSPAGWTDCRMGVDWYDSGSSYLSSSLGTATSVAAATWTSTSATVTAPASAATGRLRFRMGSTPAATDVAYVDEGVICTASATSPQTATVSGVTKALTSGSAVQVWGNGAIRY
jgi:hypothetical protein